MILLSLLIATAWARDPAVVREFKRHNQCPQELFVAGRCRGIVDHIVPLCLGGADAVSNMHWQSKEAALAKDKVEWSACKFTREMK